MQQQLQSIRSLSAALQRSAMSSKKPEALRKIVSHLLAYAAPADCVGCGTALSPHNRAVIDIPLCGPCAESIIPISEPYCKRCGIPLLSEQHHCLHCREIAEASYTNRSIFEYFGVVRALVHHYKFKRCSAIARFFAPFLVRLWQREYRGITVVPVPSSPRSIKRRGWDQIEFLLREMRYYENIPSLSLLRRRGGPSQKLLSRSQRLENAQKLFSYRYHRHIPQRIVLLDDIYTTGATLEACAALLIAQGAQEIYGLTVAVDL